MEKNKFIEQLQQENDQLKNKNENQKLSFYINDVNIVKNCNETINK